uniref:Tudor domain-containing protein 1-like n=1 Tax=Phallusia mammillata TaxID=59560 RepID=A0A6F9DUM6_9ASCI|nr:tudor domain-containing protein 1-like [Phallusia mammillata]
MPHPKDMFLPENAVMNTLAALIGQQVLECYVTEVYEKYGKPPSIGVELRTVDGEKTTLIVDQVLAALHVTL